MSVEVKIGIIGGTGLDNPDLIQDRAEKEVTTPFGKPSDVLVTGKVEGVPCVLIARHDRRHSIMPSNINYRANLWALHEEGCTHVLATTACGSLQEHIRPGDVVILDQFVDRTFKREPTFYDGKPGSPLGVCHTAMDTPYCKKTGEILFSVAKAMGLSCHAQGTVVCIEGPRFSSRAESRVFQSWGCHVVNMTAVPEVCLAKELGLCYASIALPTDYDCWKETCEPVSVEFVLRTLKQNGTKALDLIRRAVPLIAREDWTDTVAGLKKAVKDSILLP